MLVVYVFTPCPLLSLWKMLINYSVLNVASQQCMLYINLSKELKIYISSQNERPKLTTTCDIISVMCTVASRVSCNRNHGMHTLNSDKLYALAESTSTLSGSLAVLHNTHRYYKLYH